MLTFPKAIYGFYCCFEFPMYFLKANDFGTFSLPCHNFASIDFVFFSCFKALKFQKKKGFFLFCIFNGRRKVLCIRIFPLFGQEILCFNVNEISVATVRLKERTKTLPFSQWQIDRHALNGWRRQPKRDIDFKFTGDDHSAYWISSHWSGYFTLPKFISNKINFSVNEIH